VCGGGCPNTLVVRSGVKTPVHCAPPPSAANPEEDEPGSDTVL
jgi:hypothetical protein